MNLTLMSQSGRNTADRSDRHWARLRRGHSYQLLSSPRRAHTPLDLAPLSGMAFIIDITFTCETDDVLDVEFEAALVLPTAAL